MWGESSKNCENGCQCSGLITESFKINSGNNATKRKQEEASTKNFKFKMNPHSLDFKSPLDSPVIKSKRRILGEISNNTISNDTPSKRKILGDIINTESPRNSPLQRLKLDDIKSPLFDKPLSPLQRVRTENKVSPLIDRSQSPLTTRTISLRKSTTKISRIFEERSRFRMANRENKENIGSLCNETFVKFELEEETRDSFSYRSETQTMSNWSTMTKLDFTEALQETSTFSTSSVSKDFFVPEKDMDTDLDPDLETLHDLEEEFEADNFDSCTKYEIISTDSPDIISKGRSSTSRKVNARNFVFGAPLADSEQSTSFNKPNVNATRMLNFEDETFEFTSPATRKTTSSFSVKKSLKFNETPTKSPLRFTPTKETPTKPTTPNIPNGTPSKSNVTPTRNPLRHERSDSSIGSMFSSPGSSHLRLFTSESTASMESGFVSEFEEPFLELEQTKSNSPKLPNFNDLLSGQIKDNFVPMKSFLKRPTLQRSLSFNPEPKGKSLFSIQEKSPEGRKSQKRQEACAESSASKKRRAECAEPADDAVRPTRPTLHRCFSENHASIMSALARSSSEPDLIGDFSQPYALPLTGGDHSDLKSISADTLAALIRGEYQDSVEEYQVIDCRYPYEFEGGHIPGARNLYTPRLVQSLLSGQPQPAAARSILVFHCEFSLERGPKLYRYLRSSDRSKNMENYPHLNYPEVYLLHKGYRTFFQKYPDLCTGNGYTAMLDPKHSQLLRKHRSVEEPASFFTHHRKAGLAYEDFDQRTIVVPVFDTLERTTKAVHDANDAIQICTPSHKRYSGQFGYTAACGRASQAASFTVTFKVTPDGKLRLDTYVYAASWGAVTCTVTTVDIAKLCVLY